MWIRCICDKMLLESKDLCSECAYIVKGLIRSYEKEEDVELTDSEQELDYLIGLFFKDTEREF